MLKGGKAAKSLKSKHYMGNLSIWQLWPLQLLDRQDGSVHRELNADSVRIQVSKERIVCGFPGN